jgi:predicted N-acetyltransferase YhbS
LHDGVTIRKASQTDGPGILACLRIAFEPYRDKYTPEAFTDTVLTPDTIRARLGQMGVFVAVTSAGRIVGTIACSVVTSGEGHLRGMAVLPEWHGRGIAGELLQSAEEELAGKGCSRVTLDTTEPLRRAVRFYAKHGYVTSGRISNFFGMNLHEHVKDLKS